MNFRRQDDAHIPEIGVRTRGFTPPVDGVELQKKKLERLNFVIRYEEPVLRDGNEKRGGN